MFLRVTSFNGDISKWDVSSVTDMRATFMDANAFNGDISKWDVSNVTNLRGMFLGVTSFNGDISKWHVSRVTDMTGIFNQFNRDLSKWDVSSVTSMDYMFADATSFKRELCGSAWVHSKASKRGMFSGSSGSISQTVSTQFTRPYASRRPIPERELISHTPISTSVGTAAITSTITNTMTCPKCGTFEKSGRVSYCAPGGAWFKKCGGARNRNVDHKWFDGVWACKRKFNVDGM